MHESAIARAVAHTGAASSHIPTRRALRKIFARGALGFILTVSLAPAHAVDARPADAAIVLQHGSPAYLVSNLTDPVAQRYIRAFADYTSTVLGKPSVIVDSLAKVPPVQSAVLFQRGYEGLPASVAAQVRRHTDDDFALAVSHSSGRLVAIAAAAEPNGIRRAVQKLVMMSEQNPANLELRVAPHFYTPWMEQREIEPVMWSPKLVRGKFTNPAVDLRVDVQHYTDAQLDKYLAAFDWYGYSGVRVEEGAWQYGIFGSIEAEQAFVKRVAAAAAHNSLARTLHVLYADFNGYGWIDPTVTYDPAPGNTAANDPRVQATFNKYYDHYVDLVPSFDRIGGHLLDPGHLEKSSDLIYYAKLLISKARARKPNIATDVVLWVAKPDLVHAFATAGLNDVSILLSNQPVRWNTAEKQQEHELAKQLHLKLGYWSWYISDMEPDHRASMYVNSMVLKSEFDRIRRDVDGIYHPTYWSEMEGYHLLNTFSMYVSAQLQWNPNRDPHELLMEIATAIWGPNSGRKMFDVLRVIEDVRSGPNFDKYWTVPRPDNQPPTGELGTNNPQSDLARAQQALVVLQTLQPDPGFVAKVPLQCSTTDLRDLMRSHVQQIADYSKFRVELAEVRKAASGLSKEQLTQRIEAIWKPVPEYNTWIGMGSTIEFNAQERQLAAVEKEYGITVKDPDWLITRDANRILETLSRRQAYSPTRVLWQMDPNHFDSSWDSDSLIDRDFLYLSFVHRDAWRDRFALLKKRGDIQEVKAPGGTRYALTHWHDSALKNAPHQ